MKEHFDVFINSKKLKVLRYSYKEIEGEKYTILKLEDLLLKLK